MDKPVPAYLKHISTPIAEMVAVATDTHLLMFEFERRHMYDAQLDRVRALIGGEPIDGESPVFDMVRSQMEEYFRGDRLEFDLPLYVPGTPFQTRVWDALRRIPCGTTTSYGRLAASIGSPDAVRAVARANGDNRVAIIIPCHRVIGSDGSLVGYGGGLLRQKGRLQVEARLVGVSLFWLSGGRD